MNNISNENRKELFQQQLANNLVNSIKTAITECNHLSDWNHIDPIELHPKVKDIITAAKFNGMTEETLQATLQQFNRPELFITNQDKKAA